VTEKYLTPDLIAKLITFDLFLLFMRDLPYLTQQPPHIIRRFIRSVSCQFSKLIVGRTMRKIRREKSCKRRRRELW